MALALRCRVLLAFCLTAIFVSLVSCSVKDSPSTLKFALVITRHGDRTPTKKYPINQSSWKEGLGQLTGLGMKQMHDLGARLRERYVYQHKLLPETFHTDDVFVRSTSKDRTLMSAQAFLHGFYPLGTGPETFSPHRYQPVPIHASDTDTDTLLYAYKNCPRLKNMRSQHAKSSKEYQMRDGDAQQILEHLSPLFGCKYLTYKDITNIVTLINQERTHKQPSVDLSDELFERLSNDSAWLQSQKFPTREMGRLAGGNLLKEIGRRLSLAAKQDHPPPKPSGHAGCEFSKSASKGLPPKLVYYSAHDGTLLALFSALDLRNFAVPDFAAHVIFELHARETRHGLEHEVHLLYNGVPVPVPSCVSSPCRLHDFHSATRDGIEDDWHSACQQEVVHAKTPSEEPNKKTVKKKSQEESLPTVHEILVEPFMTTDWEEESSSDSPQTTITPDNNEPSLGETVFDVETPVDKRRPFRSAAPSSVYVTVPEDQSDEDCHPHCHQPRVDLR